MKYPSCAGHLRMVTENKVVIDVCDRCDAIWLDPGELDAITKPADTPLGQPVMTLRDATDLTCPRCAITDFYDMAFDAVSVSRCNGCGGVYLGIDELERLSEGITQIEIDQSIKRTPAPVRSPEQEKEEACEPGVVTHLAANVVAERLLELLVSAIFHL